MINPDLIKDLIYFKDFTAEELKKTASKFRKVYFRKYDSVYSPSDKADRVYILISGIVEMSWYHGEDDRIYNIGILSDGDIFGIGEIYFDNYYISTTALTKATLVYIEKNDFLNYLMRIPAFNDYVVLSFAKITRQRVTMTDWSNSKNIFRYFIFYLCQQFGQTGDEYIVIPKKLTYEHIAAIINLSQRHVVRLFKEFQKDGILIKKKDSIEVNKGWYEEKKKDPFYNVSFRRMFDPKMNLY